MIAVDKDLLDKVSEETGAELVAGEGSFDFVVEDDLSRALVTYALLELLSQTTLGSSDLSSVKEILDDVTIAQDDEAVTVSGLYVEGLVEEEGEELDSFGDPVEGDFLDDDEEY